MSGALSAWRSGLIRESARKSPKEHPPGKFSCCVGGSGMRLRAGLVLFMLSQKGVSNARDTEWRRFRGDGTRSRVRGGGQGPLWDAGEEALRGEGGSLVGGGGAQRGERITARLPKFGIFWRLRSEKSEEGASTLMSGPGLYGLCTLPALSCVSGNRRL